MIRKLMPFLCLILAAALILTGCKPNTPAPSPSSEQSEPIPSETLPARTPESIGNMTLGTVMYAAKQAVTVYAVDISELDGGLKTALRCLQGLVAREEDAAIYLEENDSDRTLQQYCASEYGVFFRQIDCGELFLKYSNLIDEIVIYDPAEEHSFNAALCEAAVKDGICVDSDTIISLDADVFKGKTTVDLRGRWASADEAAEYTLSELAPLCNKNYLASVNADSDMLDYLYATKALFLDTEVSDTAGLISRAAEAAGLDSFGLYFGTDSSGLVTPLSSAGYVYLPSSGLPNSTLLSSLPHLTTRLEQETPSPAETDDGKIFVSVSVFPDADLIQDVYGYSSLIQSSRLPSMHMGVAVNPVLYELAHPILCWYYQNRPEGHELISCTDGIGLTDWSAFKAEYTDALCGANKTLLADSGITLLPLSGSADTAVFAAEKLCGGSFISVPEDYTPDTAVSGDGDCVCAFVPKDSADLYTTLGNIAKNHGRGEEAVPVFVTLGGEGSISADDVARCIARLNEQYDDIFVCLSPSELLLSAGGDVYDTYAVSSAASEES